jgi:hypothetical protein
LLNDDADEEGIDEQAINIDEVKLRQAKGMDYIIANSALANSQRII